MYKKILKKMISNFIRPIFNKIGLQITKYNQYPNDFSTSDKKIWENVKPFTMTSPESIKVLIDAVKYVIDNKVEGVFVECGIWKGGSAMAMILALKELGVVNKDIYLYDTFSGMVAPSDIDVSNQWGSAKKIFSLRKITNNTSTWCLAPLNEVKKNLATTLYPDTNIHLIKGDVEKTIPAILPKKISLLRLDTDWYKSTKHELKHLFPLLSKNAVLIIDDYGCWEGAKKAIDEYISENNLCLFLSRIDSSVRVLIKT